MEGSTAPLAARRRDPGALRVTQIGLLVASLGAVLVIFDLFGLGVVGVFFAVGGAALAAPAGLGKSWFWLVAGGAIAVVVSRLVAESSETLGGWLAVIGSLALLIGAVLGYPTRDEPE